MQELHIYDWDGTLLRSPYPPVLYEGTWWDELISLTPPVVPQTPKPRWWVGAVVSSARRSLADPSVYAILLTGRQEHLRPRIEELLRQAELYFPAVHLNDDGVETLPYKQAVLRAYLGRWPGVRVRLWDDLLEIIDGLVEVAQAMGSHVNAYHVDAATMPAPPLILLPEPTVRANPAVRLGLP